MITPDELRALLQVMQEGAVTHLKLPELELERAPVPMAQPAPTLPTTASPEIPKEIEHKIEQLESIMKLDDTALVERLFPEPALESDGQVPA